MHGCHSEDLQGLLTKSQSCELSGCCAGNFDFVKSYGIKYESENPLSGVTLEFFQAISAKSVTNTVKDFTKTLWLWKIGTKASGPQVCWQTIAVHWRLMYLTPNTGESHAPLHFSGKFLPVSWTRKALFLHINSSISFKHCLIEKFCIHIWIKHKRYC